MAYLYWYNGAYRTYDYLHDNLGYTENETDYIQYKSVDNWGILDGDGYIYIDGSLEQILDGDFFKNGHVGWMDCDALAVDGRAYPSIAVDTVKCVRLADNTVSNAARITQPSENNSDEMTDYYLVQDDLAIGWCTEAELETHGWIVERMFDFFVLDATTHTPLLRAFNQIAELDAPLNPIHDGGIEHYIKVWIFNEIEQPTLQYFREIAVFNEIPQPQLESFQIYDSCNLYVIDADGITGLDGVLYPYGYAFNALKRTIEVGGVEVTQYQCDVLWNDWTTKTDAQLEDMGLSLENPIKIYIGQTTTVQSGITTLSSDYYWIYDFTASNSSNWYNPSYYAMNPPPVTSGSLMPVGVDEDPYAEVILGNGDGGTSSPTSFKITTYGSKPEIHHSPSYSVTTSTNSAMILKYNSLSYNQPFALPSDLYTISGTTLTWNTSHPLYVLLNGKEAYGS